MLSDIEAISDIAAQQHHEIRSLRGRVEDGEKLQAVTQRAADAEAELQQLQLLELRRERDQSIRATGDRAAAGLRSPDSAAGADGAHRASGRRATAPQQPTCYPAWPASALIALMLEIEAAEQEVVAVSRFIVAHS